MSSISSANFFLRSGKIVFNEGSERFEPRVTLLAELRDRDERAPRSPSRLKTDNAPLSSFKPTLSSDPPMTEAQIAVLMGQNFFGTSSRQQRGLPEYCHFGYASSSRSST